MKQIRIQCIVLIIAACWLCGLGQLEANSDGLVLKRLNVKRGVIENRGISVSDWQMQIKNNSSKEWWVATVGQKTSSDYLIVRNPKQITYKVYEKRGLKWKDSDMGWSTYVGPKDQWISVPAGKTLEFVIPIFDRFKNPDAKVKIEIRVSSENEGRDARKLFSEVYKHKSKK